MGGYKSDGFVEHFSDETALGGPGMPPLICDGIQLQRAIAEDQRIPLVDSAVDRTDPRFVLYEQAFHCGLECFEPKYFGRMRAVALR